MKLSEAIRIGSKIRPQIQGRLYKRIDGETYGSCALGAAIEAIAPIYGKAHVKAGNDRTKLLTIASAARKRLYAKYPELQQVAPNSQFLLETEILIKNDANLETRESIADWLESIGH
jgi:hypothetical protein